MVSYKRIQLDRAGDQKEGRAKYILNGRECLAEEAAVVHYAKLGYSASWTENHYWWQLMCLLFWDVIFAKVRGAVSVMISGTKVELEPTDPTFDRMFEQMTGINGMPSDFFTPEFYVRREKLIRNRIRELENSDLTEKLKSSHKQNRGKTCRPIEDWDKFTLDQLCTATHRVEREKLLRILERLITNFSENRQGLPDLMVYNDKELFFSEVKSERDRISEKQHEWHDFLSTTLGFRVEILLINQPEAQLEKMKKSRRPHTSQVTVAFGFSSSKKLADAIALIQKQKSYTSQGEGREQTHSAAFTIDEDGVSDLFKILDLTSGWKTQEIRIDDDLIRPGDLRSSLWCFREKVKQKASSDYCKRGEYDNKPNKLGCRNIHFHELETQDWQDYGYVDTAEDKWVFNREQIDKKIEDEVERFRYCPHLDVKRVKRVSKKIPSTVDPKTDADWAFVDSTYRSWFWHEGSWLGSYGETEFPGLSAMVGVKKLTGREKAEAIRYAQLDVPGETKGARPRGKKKTASGCFIATAAYGEPGSRQLQVLRFLRDTHLKRWAFGPFLLSAYYRISPGIARHVRGYPLLRSCVRHVLNVVVRVLAQYTDVPQNSSTG